MLSSSILEFQEKYEEKLRKRINSLRLISSENKLKRFYPILFEKYKIYEEFYASLRGIKKILEDPKKNTLEKLQIRKELVNLYKEQDIDLEAKRRLLYLLDGYGKNLYSPGNLKVTTANIETRNLDRDEDLFDFYLIARLLLVDILEGWTEKDDLLLRKLVYIQTYYDISKDKVIEKILDKYKDTLLGENVRAAIINHDYSRMKLLTTSYQKKKTMN